MRTFSWEQPAIKMLHTREEIRFLATEDLRRLYEEAGRLGGRPAATNEAADNAVFARWSASLVKRGFLMHVQRGLYCNVSNPRRPQPAEAAQHVRPTAVVSLQSVLGPANITNNPPRTVFAVIGSGGPDGTRQREVTLDIQEGADTAHWDFKFVALDDDRYAAGALNDRLDASKSYPCATVERALCDYLLVTSMPKYKMETALLAEMDIDGIDMDRMERLVSAMGIETIWQRFLAERPADPDEPYSSRFGI